MADTHYINTSIFDLDGEIWVDIQGYEGYYMVSNFGRIKSVERLSVQKHYLKETILVQTFDIDNYVCVNLYIKGKVKRIKVHRLVAKAFIDNPEMKPQVNHKYGIKTDNISCKLEWNTHKENTAHAWETGLKKMTDTQRKNASLALKGGLSYKARAILNTETGIFYETIGEAAVAYNIKRQTLNAMLTGKNPNRTSFIYA